MVMLPILATVLVGIVTAAPTVTTSSLTTAPKPRVTTPPGCSPITLTSTTVTVYSPATYITVPNSVTTTSTIGQVAYTFETVATATYTDTVYKSTRTITTPYYTTTATVFAPFKTTITVPSPAVFTPVLCEAAYYISAATYTSYTTSTVTADSVTYVFPSSTITWTRNVTEDVIRTTTLPLTTSTTSVTVTKTSTIQRPTRTKFLVCATKNLAIQNPNGTLITYVNPNRNRKTLQPYSESRVVLASDATDCCEQCQSQRNCTGSAFVWMEGSRRVGSCSLFAALDGTCNQRSFFAEQALGQTFNPLPRNYTISNGRCGQYDFNP